MAKKVEIKDFRKIPSPDPKRLGKVDRVYIVETDPGVRLVIRVPDEDFTDAKLVEAIRAEIQTRGTEIAKPIEI